MSLSIVMVTKNSSSVIEGAFKSIGGLWDELVIVDSGSNDGTIEVEKMFTKNVFVHPFHNDFSEIKNFGLSKISGDWVLSLDADERLSEETKRQIPNLIKNNKVDGYWLRRRTFVSTNEYFRYGLFYPDWQLRLFRNKREYRFEGAVHEQLTISKEKTKEVPYDILHYPQHPKYDSFRSFYNLIPYVTIHAKELTASKRSVFSLFVTGMGKFFELFLGGFIRGKGYLDGWLGFRAHVMFAASIALAYGVAGWKKFMGDV